MGNGFKIGQIAGIAIKLDWSLLIIFGLIASSLGAGVFPSWHPDWNAGMVWGTALAAAVLFLLSVLLHELSHAIVGRRFGAEVPAITLFVFGGMAQMEREPETWKAEFWMAIVGPITSLVIGFVCLFAAGAVGGISEADMENPQEMLNQLNPLATLLLWLGPINIILGLFNLVPGYPLDGGRVVRAILWRVTGSQVKATRWASWAGQGFAWLLIAAGLAMMFGNAVPVFGGGFVNGLWLVLIGWFLNNAAIMTYQQLVVHRSLSETPVERLMQTDMATVAPDTRIGELVDRYLMRSSQRAFPVSRGDEFLGLVCLEDIRAVAPEDRQTITAADVMTPKERLHTVDAAEDSAEALLVLTRRNINQVPVLDQGRLVGLATRENLLRWLSLNSQSGVPQRAKARDNAR